MKDITSLKEGRTSKSVDKGCNETDFPTSIARISAAFSSVDSGKLEIRQNSGVIPCPGNIITLPSGDIVPLNICPGWDQDYDTNILVGDQVEFFFLTQLCANRVFEEYL